MVGLFGCGAAHCTDEKLQEPQVNWKVMLASRSQLKHPQRLRKTLGTDLRRDSWLRGGDAGNRIKRVEKTRPALQPPGPVASHHTRQK